MSEPDLMVPNLMKQNKHLEKKTPTCAASLKRRTKVKNETMENSNMV